MWEIWLTRLSMLPSSILSCYLSTLIPQHASLLTRQTCPFMPQCETVWLDRNSTNDMTNMIYMNRFELSLAGLLPKLKVCVNTWTNCTKLWLERGHREQKQGWSTDNHSCNKCLTHLTFKIKQMDKISGVESILALHNFSTFLKRHIDFSDCLFILSTHSSYNIRNDIVTDYLNSRDALKCIYLFHSTIYSIQFKMLTRRRCHVQAYEGVSCRRRHHVRQMQT